MNQEELILESTGPPAEITNTIYIQLNQNTPQSKDDSKAKNVKIEKL